MDEKTRRFLVAVNFFIFCYAPVNKNGVRKIHPFVFEICHAKRIAQYITYMIFEKGRNGRVVITASTADCIEYDMGSLSL